jgi:hypothetical protein
MSSVEEFSSVESKPIASLDSTHEPSPEPRTSKERVIHPSEFPIKFEDYGNALKLFWHKKHTNPPIASLKVEPSKEWLMEVKHSSEAIWILSPSTTMPCSLRGTNTEALRNPTVETNITSEFLAETLLGKMPLVSTNKLFKSPSGLIFECCGIARALPIIIEKIKVFIDFHIYVILEFDILLGYPLENLIQEKPSHRGLDEK